MGSNGRLGVIRFLVYIFEKRAKRGQKFPQFDPSEYEFKSLHPDTMCIGVFWSGSSIFNLITDLLNINGFYGLPKD